MSWVTLLGAAALILLGLGIELGRWLGRRECDQEETLRQEALLALGSSPNRQGCPYRVDSVEPKLCPMCHSNLSGNLDVRACQPTDRKAFCKWQHGHHLHLVCHHCRYEWLYEKL